jgi:hypothetical protein
VRDERYRWSWGRLFGENDGGWVLATLHITGGFAREGVYASEAVDVGVNLVAEFAWEAEEWKYAGVGRSTGV